MLYAKLADKKVKCNLCSHDCTIIDGGRGICCVRENRDGILYSLVYRRLISSAVDPIEKKPLFHFLPGSESYSIATLGCNFRCEFCQNWRISQIEKDGNIRGEDQPPKQIVDSAEGAGCKSIAYTYTEPTIFFEYAYDTAKTAHDRGLRNIFVTNGFMTEEALRTIEPYLDAANVDLKSFSDDFYRKICGARLEPVLSTIKQMKKRGIWVEITTLLIPDMNDSEDELRQIAEFIKDVGDEIPWHISRFHPDYKLDHMDPTSAETIHKAMEIGRDAGLKYIYAGNLPGDIGENTYCYNCGELLIKRRLFTVLENHVKYYRCYNCGVEIHGVGLWANNPHGDQLE